MRERASSYQSRDSKNLAKSKGVRQFERAICVERAMPPGERGTGAFRCGIQSGTKAKDIKFSSRRLQALPSRTGTVPGDNEPPTQKLVFGLALTRSGLSLVQGTWLRCFLDRCNVAADISPAYV